MLITVYFSSHMIIHVVLFIYMVISHIKVLFMNQYHIEFDFGIFSHIP